MRIESVNAHAFGPLTAAELKLTPGMNVITGANESAKSSWHAALHAALTGRRRGKGAPTREERRFAELHKPWDGDQWRVSAVVVLDDGKRVELTHDLDGKVDCRAMDLTLGTDISADIIFEGSPDASRYLGLDRKSFAATAVVNQADLLSVLAAADGLQEHLQRAAATAGTDGTAAAALNALEKFTRENVGLDRSNSTKPLRTTKSALDRAEADLIEALGEHEHYLELMTDADSQRVAATRATKIVATAQAAVTALGQLVAASRTAAQRRREADRTATVAEEASAQLVALARRAERARTLSAEIASTPVTEGGPAAEALARTVAAAVAGWSAAPAVRVPSGPTVAELQAQLDALPPVPQGDTNVALAVREAADACTRARAVVAAHEERRPPEASEAGPDLGPAVAAGPAMLRQLAAELSAAQDRNPAGLTDLTDALERARADQQDAEATAEAAEAAMRAARDAHTAALAAPQAAATSRGPRIALLIVGGLALVAAVVAAVASIPAVAAIAAVVGVAAVAAGFLVRRPAPAPSAPTADAATLGTPVRNAEQAVHDAQAHMYRAMSVVAAADAQLRAAQTSSSASTEVAARCAARALPADVSDLQQLAARAEQHLDALQTYTRWKDLVAQDTAKLARAESVLLTELSERGQRVTAGSVMDALKAYEQACTERAQQGALAAGRAELERAHELRLSADQEAANVAAQRAAALQGLVDAAGAAGAKIEPGADPKVVAEALTQWQAGYDQMLQRAGARQQDLSQLDAVLDGSSLDDLEIALSAAREKVAALEAAAAAAEGIWAQAFADAEACGVAVRGLDGRAVGDVEVVKGQLDQAEEHLAGARAEELDLAKAAENAAGVAAERGRSLASVAEAEERKAAAATEYARVSELANTLELTQSFLAAAQDQVHRSIAPVLTDTLRTWLPLVTNGRYTDVTVNPGTLEVRVCGPQRKWRHADRLSVGTAEQIYLLLRVALAQHLATTSESCPLLLDDVTVQADPERTVEILNLLLALSADRQVIVFAQEPAVAAWAHANLDDPRDSLREMTRVTVE